MSRSGAFPIIALLALLSIAAPRAAFAVRANPPAQSASQSDDGFSQSALASPSSPGGKVTGWPAWLDNSTPA
jgi:hypothetical protein